MPDLHKRRTGLDGPQRGRNGHRKCRRGSTRAKLGTVFLVGAGPGAPDLITVRGRRLLAQADVVVHDRLVSCALLAYARADAEIIDVRKTCGHGEHAQDKIHTILIDRAQRGQTIVRLKGGDPFVFGRGWEEWCACRAAAVPCIVVPGVTSALAVPATVGIPTTHRGTGRTFAVIAAQGCTSDEAAGLDYGVLAKIATVVILMGRSNLARVAQSLIAAGRDPDTPAACIERGTTPRQRSVLATLAAIAEAADREGLQAPVVTVVGEVARCAEEYDKHIESMFGTAVKRPDLLERNSLLCSGLSVAGCSSGCVNPRGLKPAARNTEAGNALAGRRVVITRSTSSLHELRARLTAAGAITIEAPMIRIAYPANPDGLDPAIADLGSYGWVAFASVHGVRGFFEGLATLGQDARALAPCKVAAIGPITASALRKRGIHADLVAKPYSASALIAGVRADIGSRPSRILCPCGDVAPTEMSQGMRQAGLAVDEVATYCTITLTLPESVLRAIGEGVDAILLCSPSAARRFGTLNLNLAGAAVACIGPSTASAARAAGMPVDVIAEDHTDGGLVAALAQRFGSDREGNWGPPSPADRNTTSKKSTSTTSRKRAPRSCST